MLSVFFSLKRIFLNILIRAPNYDIKEEENRQRQSFGSRKVEKLFFLCGSEWKADLFDLYTTGSCCQRVSIQRHYDNHAVRYDKYNRNLHEDIVAELERSLKK